MGWTKRQIIEDAYGELALAGYVFDIQPEEMQAALRKLDTMMGTWSAQGVRLPYAFGATPDSSDLDQDSGLPLLAVGAVHLALAVQIAASKGKALAASTKSNAKQAYDALVSYLADAELGEQQLPNTLPLGAGTKPWRTINRPFMPTPDTAPIQIGADGGLDFSGD